MQHTISLKNLCTSPNALTICSVFQTSCKISKRNTLIAIMTRIFKKQQKLIKLLLYFVVSSHKINPHVFCHDHDISAQKKQFRSYRSRILLTCTKYNIMAKQKNTIYIYIYRLLFTWNNNQKINSCWYWFKLY